MPAVFDTFIQTFDPRMTIRILRRISHSLLVVTICSLTALAQGGGTVVSGIVRDQATQAGMPGVNVLVKGTNTVR